MKKEEEILENNHNNSMGTTKFKLFGVEIIGFKLMGVDTFTVTKQVNEIKQETEEKKKIEAEINGKQKMPKRPRTLIRDYFSGIGIDHQRSFFTIRKKLKQSDVNFLSRLMLPKKLVYNHIKPNLTAEQNRDVESGKGTDILIMDLDTKPCYCLVLKRSVKANSYVIKTNWIKSFVIRRDLIEGDEIGMFWDPSESCFAFSVLQRARRPPPTTGAC